MHNSHDQYLDEMMEMLHDLEPDFKRLMRQFLEPVVEGYWTQYIVGDRPSYMITEEDFDSAYQHASTETMQESLNVLSDVGLVNVSFNSNGEIVYSVSQAGKDFLRGLK